jgi:hypothetical protein
VKQVTAICLVLLMSLQCFYKLGVIAYFNFNREYIAEVLCLNKEKPMQSCHGQCFLKTNLNLAEESPSKSAEVPITKQQIEFPLFIISELAYNFRVVSTTTEESSHYYLVTSLGHLPILFRPPAFFS